METRSSPYIILQREPGGLVQVRNIGKARQAALGDEGDLFLQQETNDELLSPRALLPQRHGDPFKGAAAACAGTVSIVHECLELVVGLWVEGFPWFILKSYGDC